MKTASSENATKPSTMTLMARCLVQMLLLGAATAVPVYVYAAMSRHSQQYQPEDTQVELS